MAKNPGSFVKKKSVERYARRFGGASAKKRFGASIFSQGMRRGRAPASSGGGGGSSGGRSSAGSSGPGRTRRALGWIGRTTADRASDSWSDRRSTRERVGDNFSGVRSVISGFLGPVIFWVIIITVVGGSLVFGIQAYRTGSLGDIWERGETGAENIGVTEGISTVWDEGLGLLTDPTKFRKQLSVESDIYETEDSELLGIRVNKPESTGGVKRAGNKLRTLVAIEGRTPKNTKVTVSCKGDDGLKGGDFEIDLQEIGENLYAASETVVCEYTPPDSNKKLITMTTYVTTKYEFENEASLRVYVLGKEAKEELGAENPLQKDNIAELDPQLRQTDAGTYRTRSQADAGPVNLGIVSGDSQPFVEERPVRTVDGDAVPYIAEIGLSKQSGWQGGIREIKDVRVYMPEIFTFVEEEGDFTATGEKGDNEFIEYGLKPEKLLELGKICESETIKESECHEEMEEEARFYIAFNVEPPGESGLYFTYIRSKADYVFETVGDKATETIQNDEATV